MMQNPYSGVDFAVLSHIPSVSHYHAETSTNFDRLHDNGIVHIGISNYYPSKPCYPLADFYTPYTGMIDCPNAEHHNFTNYFGAGDRLHLNGLGSLCESGNVRGGTPVGFGGMMWKQAINQILSNLLYEDSGGITINHPVWTGLTAKDCCDILDYDSRVLGVEIFNQSTEESIGNGVFVDGWDTILKTGRKCYGFSVPDHRSATIRGRNILLADGTIHDCLKAYRDGRFYAKIGTSDFKFTGIGYDNNILSVSVDRPAQIKIITDSSVDTFTGTSAEKTLNADGYVYVRVEARSQADDDTIYSNAIMLNKQGKEITDNGMNFAVLNFLMD